MLGSIIGDIAGSYLEVLEVKAIKTEEDKKRPYEERMKIMECVLELAKLNQLSE